MGTLRKAVWGAVVVLMLSATSGFAQTHPCDTAPTQTIFSGQVKAQWCTDSKDTDGNPTVITLVKVYIDGNSTPTWTGAPILVTPTANANGLKMYESGLFSIPKGTHSVRAAQANATGDGSLSVPFSFGIQDALPGTVIQLRIAK